VKDLNVEVDSFEGGSSGHMSIGAIGSAWVVAHEWVP